MTNSQWNWYATQELAGILARDGLQCPRCKRITQDIEVTIDDSRFHCNDCNSDFLPADYHAALRRPPETGISTLYRPVGENELAKIEQTHFTRFPPRLQWQPIFYPVLTQDYADANARDEEIQMPNPQIDPNLGLMLYKKGWQGGLIGVGIIVLVLACLCGMNVFLDEKLAMRIASVGLFLFMGSLGVVFVRMGARVFYLYENGVVSGDTALTFEEIESYCRETTHISSVGIHTQTNIRLIFIPFENTMKRKLRFVWQTGRKGDHEIEDFHERIVMAIINRIQNQIDKEGQASWMNGLTFRGDGLEYTSQNGLSSIVPYEQIAEPEIGTRLTSGAEIHLHRLDSSELIARMRADGPNVVPGLLVLESMCDKVNQ